MTDRTKDEARATAELDREAVPGAVSMDDLVDAAALGDAERLQDGRRAFEIEVGGRVVEQYFARHVHAGAVLIRRRHGANDSYDIRVAYEAGHADPQFDETLRALRSEERQARVLLNYRPRNTVTQDVYTTIVYLLNVLDSGLRPGGADADERRRQMTAAVTSAKRELVRVRAFIKKATRNAALRWYLFGLPLGAAAGVVITLLMYRSPIRISDVDPSNYPLSLCLASGAIGAIVSVMVRITRGLSLDVDSDQGRGVTLVAGAFRPVIGAVFGISIYVLIRGGLVPFAVPPAGGGSDPALFFAGLAFLAGFSERWAQDTIVNSAPRLEASPSAVGRTKVEGVERVEGAP